MTTTITLTELVTKTDATELLDLLFSEDVVVTEDDGNDLEDFE